MKRLYDRNHTARRVLRRFVWTTHAGERVRLSEMATLHLFYALRMVFNHSSPVRVGKFIRYVDVPMWSLAYRRAAMTAFVEELIFRLGELDDDNRRQFFQITGLAIIQNLI